MATTYTVQPGDTLSEIADRFNVSLQSLLAANPQITDPGRIFPGQVINIPQTARTYVVQPGDTLNEIADRFNVSPQALIAANPQITDPDRIFPGQVLTIPGGTTAVVTYVVQRGDTLSEIAERFNVSLQSLLAANPQITDPDRIFPGQVITILRPPRTYVVQPGDTLSEIADRFNVNLQALIAANPQITDPDRIFPGQVINIP